MQSYKKAAPRLVLLIILAVVTAAVTLRGQEQKTSTTNQQNGRARRELPTVDYGVPESSSETEQTKRKAKSKRYDNQGSQPIQDSPQASGRIWSSHWARGLPAVPTEQSDTILIGRILDAQAYLSNDKTSVYSEYTVLIEEMLKGDPRPPVSENKITIQRAGGAVRFPSGRIQRDETSGQGIPTIGSRYVLFLKRLDLEEDFSLITGYELRAAQVFPLDGASVEGGSQKFPFDEFTGADAPSFLKLVNDSIAQKSRNLPEQRR
jgi:hypothetical protein